MAALADAVRTAHLARHAQGEAARVQHMSPEDREERQAHRTAEEAARIQHMSPDSGTEQPTKHTTLKEKLPEFVTSRSKFSTTFVSIETVTRSSWRTPSIGMISFEGFNN